MFKIFSLIGFVAATAASAASWPMVTVDASGNIVLNAPTQAKSFSLTPETISALPETGTAVSLTSVAALTTGVDTFKVSVSSTLASSGGFKLPAPTVGRTITLFNDGTSARAFTVYTDATSTFFDNSASKTSYSVAATTSMVTFTATDTTNWAVTSNAAATGSSSVGFSTVTDVSSITAATSTTLTASNIVNGIYTVKANTGGIVTLTLPAVADVESALGTAAAVGSTFTLRVVNRATPVAATDLKILMATATGYTIYGSLIVAPQTQRVYTFIRTAASTYDVYAGRAEYGTLTAVTSTETTASATVPAHTCNAIRCSITPATTLPASAGAGQRSAAQLFTITNAYRELNDMINIEHAGSATTAEGAICDVGSLPTATATPAAGTILMTCAAVSNAAAIVTAFVTLGKN